jgi:hypothetical protein
LIPAEQAAVFEAIRDNAKTGNPQAVREYREWLTRLHLVSSDQDASALSKRLEDMSPDELAFADAWAERQFARAAKRLAGLRRVAPARAADNQRREELDEYVSRRRVEHLSFDKSGLFEPLADIQHEEVVSAQAGSRSRLAHDVASVWRA